ncbi:MAG: helix-turn-helix domain-containing protein [Rhodospirillales bacterium]|nr:helix-turn-helix domain-containing protein [Rhodospirillales bacterium]
MPLTLKALRKKDYSEYPKTLGEHLKKRRRELGLLQREAGEWMGVSADTIVNWEKDRARPVPSQFKPVVAFLGYDPTPVTASLAERFEAKRRSLGATIDQVAQYLGWDEGSLRRYLRGEWQLSCERADALEEFLGLTAPAAASVLAMPRRKRWSA